MSYKINDHNVYLIVLVIFTLSTLLIPIIKKIAFHVNAIDYPNERKVHTKPMPRLGGLAIFLAFLAGYILFAQNMKEMLGIFMGGIILLLVGFIDDINPISSKYKLLGQIISASIVVYYGGILLSHISAFGIYIDFGNFSSVVTVIFIVALANAINLIDGLDGLSGGISSIYFGTILVIAILTGKMIGLEVMLSSIMLGAILGFLVHNFYPAKIFAGDSGSMFMGYMIAIVALLGFKNVTLTSLIVPVLILAIPIIDTILAIFRRFLAGKPIGLADKDHIHHQLLKMRFSTRTTVLIIYAVNILFSLVSIFYVVGNSKQAMTLYIVLMLILIVFVLKTNVLYDHDARKNKNNKKKKEIT